MEHGGHHTPGHAPASTVEQPSTGDGENARGSAVISRATSFWSAERSGLPSDGTIDERLGLLDDRVEVRFILEALGVNLVDVLGA